MSLSILTLTTSVAQLRKQIVYTRSRLYADVRGESFRARFDQLRMEWRALLLREVELQDDQTTTGAEVESADVGLDVLVDEVDEATEGDEALRALLFKKKTPSAFKKPIAGVQLSEMESWEGTLSRAEAPKAQALAKKVAEQVAKARAAVSKRTEAAQQLKEFYATSERRRFIEQVNTVRAEVYSFFLQLITNEPSLKLTQQYARSFFLVTGDYSSVSTEEELSRVQERLEELRQELAQFEAREAELVAQKEAQAQEEAQELAQQRKQEELERQLAELKAQRAKKRR